MKTSRNDPCPCGSGKKYKACCMPRDLARDRVKAVVGDEFFDMAEGMVRSAIGEQTVWEAEVVALQRPTEEGASSLLVIAAAGFVVHVEGVFRSPATAEERATIIAQAISPAARAAGSLPERLHVRDAEIAAALGPRLRARGMEVHAAEIPELDEALEAFLGQMEEHRSANITTPDTWRETGASLEELAEFHRAAAEFYRVTPWNDGEMQIPFLLEFPSEERPWGASVMGDAGMAYGLALYSNPLDLLSLLASEPAVAGVPSMQGYALSVDFDRRDTLTTYMQREITAAGWPVAGPRAYPRLFALNTEETGVTAAHVRQATLALRAMNVLAAGEDPEEETGVAVSVFPLPGELLDDEDDEDEDEEWDEEEEGLGWFLLPDAAAPICPEGPGADPEAAIGAWDDHERMKAEEEERHARLEAWLPTAIQTVRKVDRENARHWTDHLVAMGIPAGAFTEHDLRLFIYDLYVRKSGATKTAIRRMPQLLPWIFRFLQEQEGIRYPFAEAVLEELREVVLRSQAEGRLLENTLDALSDEVYGDLDARAMLHTRSVIDGSVGWPDMMNADVADLDRELQRRWLLWYDELVRAGTVDFTELEDALTARQIRWENTPHPAYDGQTPAEVVRAYTSSEQYLGTDQTELMELLRTMRQ
jgi:hypothetical protein